MHSNLWGSQKAVRRYITDRMHTQSIAIWRFTGRTLSDMGYRLRVRVCTSNHEEPVSHTIREIRYGWSRWIIVAQAIHGMGDMAAWPGGTSLVAPVTRRF